MGEYEGVRESVGAVVQEGGRESGVGREEGAGAAGFGDGGGGGGGGRFRGGRFGWGGGCGCGEGDGGEQPDEEFCWEGEIHAGWKKTLSMIYYLRDKGVIKCAAVFFFLKN